MTLFQKGGELLMAEEITQNPVQGTPLSKETPHQTFEEATEARGEVRPANAHDAAVKAQMLFTGGLVVPQDNSEGAMTTPFANSQEANIKIAAKQGGQK